MMAFLLFLSLQASAQSNGCKPENLARLSSIEKKLIDYSTKVDAFKQKNPTAFPPSRQPSSEHIQFCLTGGVRDAGKLALEGLSINDELEAFANSQGGACKEAAQQAFSNLETRVNDLMKYTKSCG
jgi:hypothetical protein